MVATNYGKIQGVQKDGYTVYYGIPYAAPPVGHLRWKAPQQAQTWEGVYLADHVRGRCLQRPRQPGDFYDTEFGSDMEENTPMSEDCLYLNIWVPDGAEGKKLPVAFWIHGGAFLNGCGHKKQFDGSGFAKEDIILVTINYRLGVWGFLAHPWLSEENEHDVSGNYGILDQIAALRWVYENIGSFGGNRDNITVFGQSAGAVSVLTLVSSELTQGMIAKAIIQSGLGLEGSATLATAEANGLIFAEDAGVSSLEELRNLPVDIVNKCAAPLIMKGFQKGFQSGEASTYGPVADGYVLKDTYYNLWRAGKIHPIPYIVGSNKNDMLTSSEALARGEKGFLYDGVAKFAQTISAQSDIPVYAYYFTHQLPGDESGAFHSAELWYTFASMKNAWRPWEQKDWELAEKIHGIWCEFMKSGNVNWEAYSLQHGHIQELG